MTQYSEIGILEDEDLSALCYTGLSDDSFDEEEETQSEMQRTGGDATIAQVMRDNIDREERAELKRSARTLTLTQISSCRRGKIPAHAAMWRASDRMQYDPFPVARN